MTPIVEEVELNNAHIEEVFLGREDHGVYTFTVKLDYGGMIQHAGTYILSNYGKRPTKDQLLITKFIVKVVGAKNWKGLVGHWCRAIHTHDHVYAIGNITEDEWIDFRAYFKRGRRTIRGLHHVLADLGWPHVSMDGMRFQRISSWSVPPEMTLDGKLTRIKC